MERRLLSQDEVKKIEHEKNLLINEERPAVIAAIAQARELGDLSENAEYHAAREKQSFIESKIADLESILAQSDVVSPEKIVSDTVQFGATVIVKDLDTGSIQSYKILSEYSSNPSDGIISYRSPVAKSLIGNKINDTVVLENPKGKRHLMITDVRYK